MLRTTLLGVALAVSVAACSKQDNSAMNGDSTLGSAAGAMSSAADSMGSMAASAGSTAVAAGSTATSSAAGSIDAMTDRAGAAVDTLANKTGAAMSSAKSSAAAGAAAVGDAASTAVLRTKLSTLSSDQVKQLQKALNDNGCEAGPVDGMVGAQTRRGVECGLRKNNISGTDLDSLYSALDLNFGS